MSSVIKPAALLMSGRAVGFVASFAVPIVLARVFSQGEFGTYKQVFLIYGTLYGIAQLGMAESLYYFLPGRVRSGARFAANALLVLVAAGAACFVLVWFLRGRIAQWFGNAELAGDAPLVAAFLALAVSAAMLEIVMTARRQFRAAACTYGASDFLRAAFFLIPVMLVGGLHVLLLGAVAFAAIRFAATVAYLHRRYAGGLRPDAALLRRQFAYAMPFAFAVLIEVVQTNLHLYVVGYYFDAAAFAVYSVGCLQVPLVDLMMTSTSSVMMVQMRERLQAGEPEAVLRLWRDTTTKLGLAFIPLVGGLIVLAQPLITVLFTTRYEASVPLFMVAATSILFAVVMSDSVLRVYAQMRYLVAANGVRLAFVAATISVALREFGLVGGVAVTVLAAALFKVLTLARIRTLFRCRAAQLLPWSDLGRTAVLSAAAAVPALGARALLGAHPLSALLAGATAYAATCLVLLYFWGPLERERKNALLTAAYRPVSRRFGATERRPGLLRREVGKAGGPSP